MKLLLGSLLMIISVNALADCSISTSGLSYHDMKGIPSLEKNLIKKGFEIQNEGQAEYELSARYAYIDHIGVSKQQLHILLHQDGVKVFDTKSVVYETVIGVLFERKALKEFASKIPTCAELQDSSY